jgi:hypothetical protein
MATTVQQVASVPHQPCIKCPTDPALHPYYVSERTERGPGFGAHLCPLHLKKHIAFFSKKRDGTHGSFILKRP